MQPKFQLGESDFVTIRREGLLYIDKTSFISDVLSDSFKVILLPRPRRFGKTLNMSTLRTFLEINPQNSRELFDGLEVSRTPEVWEHFQRYPVLWISFKDVKQDSWDEAWALIRQEIEYMYLAHSYLESSPHLSPADVAKFKAALNGTADDATYSNSLKDLSRWLHLHHGVPAVILIDEYDTPIDHAFVQGLRAHDEARAFYESTVTFFRNFLSGGLKDNTHLFRSVLTGILRVSKETLFSGLNNLNVYSILMDRYRTTFGFTDEEVVQLTKDVGHPEIMDDMRHMYNGYIFGENHPVAIYNPWSTLSAISYQPPRLAAYWINTGGTGLLRELLLGQGQGLNQDMRTLIAGGQLTRTIDEHVVLRELDTDSRAIWSFLLFSGYLKTLSTHTTVAACVATLAVPNLEVHKVYRDLFLGWVSERLGGYDLAEEFLRALLQGSSTALEEHLSRLLRVSGSPFDPTGPQPEKFYHGLVLGLLVMLEGRYAVRSNASSGYGRVDLLLRPLQPGQPGALLELKVVKDGQRPLAALKEALEQIRDTAYLTELEASGATPIHAFGVAFDGQRVWVRPYADLEAVQKAATEEALHFQRAGKGSIQDLQGGLEAPLLAPLERQELVEFLANQLGRKDMSYLCELMGLKVPRSGSDPFRWARALTAIEAQGRVSLQTFLTMLVRHKPGLGAAPAFKVLTERLRE